MVLFDVTLLTHDPSPPPPHPPHFVTGPHMISRPLWGALRLLTSSMSTLLFSASLLPLPFRVTKSDIFYSPSKDHISDSEVTAEY